MTAPFVRVVLVLALLTLLIDAQHHGKGALHWRQASSNDASSFSVSDNSQVSAASSGSSISSPSAPLSPASSDTSSSRSTSHQGGTSSSSTSTSTSDSQTSPTTSPTTSPSTSSTSSTSTTQSKETPLSLRESTPHVTRPVSQQNNSLFGKGSSNTETTQKSSQSSSRHSAQSTHKSSSSTTPHKTSTPLYGTFTRPHVVVTTSTDSRGGTTVRRITTDGVFTSATGYSKPTEGPQLHPDGSSGGLNDSAKKIVGGVVGGIGGAILIGGLAVVAWRLWRKKRRQREQEDLMSNDPGAYSPQGYMVREDKPPSQGSTQALSEPLDRYHQPTTVNTTVNTASNF